MFDKRLEYPTGLFRRIEAVLKHAAHGEHRPRGERTVRVAGQLGPTVGQLARTDTLWAKPLLAPLTKPACAGRRVHAAAAVMAAHDGELTRPLPG